MELRLERLEEEGITVNQFALLFIVESNLFFNCIKKDWNDLLILQEKLLLKVLPNKIILRIKGLNLVKHHNSPVKIDGVLELTRELRAIFPEGKKMGTVFRWKGTEIDVANKLKKFMTNHPNYSTEQIKLATKNYVDSFKYENMQYMHLLVYFIEKNSVSKLLEELEAIKEGDIIKIRERETSL